MAVGMELDSLIPTAEVSQERLALVLCSSESAVQEWPVAPAVSGLKTGPGGVGKQIRIDTSGSFR